MADGRWQMANGKWQMANGKWQMADGKSQMAEMAPPFHDSRIAGSRVAS
jgi:hypothetical protein